MHQFNSSSTGHECGVPPTLAKRIAAAERASALRRHGEWWFKEGEENVAIHEPDEAKEKTNDAFFVLEEKGADDG